MHSPASNNDKDPCELSVTSEPSVCVCVGGGGPEIALWEITNPNFYYFLGYHENIDKKYVNFLEIRKLFH